MHRWYKYRHLDFFSTRSSSVISEAARKREVQARAALGAPPPLTFNGAREEATKASRLGISQAWSVDHLDAEIAQRNREALVEVARVLKQYPELRCEVHGETSTPHSGACDPDLAGYFGFDAETDLKPTMDELAKRRAEACLEALVDRGVPRARLTVTFKGCSDQQRVSFLPSIDEGGAAGGYGGYAEETSLWSDVKTADALLAAAAAARSSAGGGSLLAQPGLTDFGPAASAYGASTPVRQPPRLPKLGEEEGADYFDPTAQGGSPPAEEASTAASRDQRRQPLAPPPPEFEPMPPSLRAAPPAAQQQPVAPEVDPSSFPNLRRQKPHGGGTMDVL